jgi:hypothetical protein
MDASLFCRQIKCYALNSLHTHTQNGRQVAPQESVMGIFPLKNKEKHEKMMNNQVGGGRI